MRTDYILRVSQSRLQDANAEHSKAIDRVAEVLEARSADTTYDMVGLRKDTLDSSNIYHSTAAAILQNVADSVVSDHKVPPSSSSFLPTASALTGRVVWCGACGAVPPVGRGQAGQAHGGHHGGARGRPAGGVVGAPGARGASAH